MSYIVEGFSFKTQEEAEAAKKEVQSVKYIKGRSLNLKHDKILEVYNKLISDKMLTTPIGIAYLYELREQLMLYPDINNDLILPIEITQNVIVKEISARTDYREVNISKKEDTKNYKLRFKNSLIINFILALAIIAMLIIVNTSNNINILNYKDKLIDRYQQWEQELNLREEKIKDIEKKYNI